MVPGVLDGDAWHVGRHGGRNEEADVTFHEEIYDAEEEEDELKMVQVNKRSGTYLCLEPHFSLN